MLGPGSPSRRGVVLAGGALLLTACDLDPRAEPSAAPTTTAGAPADPSVEADLGLLDDVRLAVRGVRAQVSLTRHTHPQLRRALAPLGELHRAHLRTLAGAGRSEEVGISPSPIDTDDPSAALAAVRRLELGHQRFLARSCVQAASGPFARMLASMSAGVAAHLAVLPDQP